MGQLTFFERQKIEYYLRCRLKVRAIAKLLGQDHSVVSREVQRNKSPFFPYEAVIAQKAAEQTAKFTNKRKLLKDQRLRDYVEAQLRIGWSPEQIVGRLKNQPPLNLKGKKICQETIYQYIYTGARDIHGEWLYRYLRRAQPQRQLRYQRKHRSVNGCQLIMSLAFLKKWRLGTTWSYKKWPKNELSVCLTNRGCFNIFPPLPSYLINRYTTRG